MRSKKITLDEFKNLVSKNEIINEQIKVVNWKKEEFYILSPKRFKELKFLEDEENEWLYEEAMKGLKSGMLSVEESKKFMEANKTSNGI